MACLPFGAGACTRWKQTVTFRGLGRGWLPALKPLPKFFILQLKFPGKLSPPFCPSSRAPAPPPFNPDLKPFALGHLAFGPVDNPLLINKNLLLNLDHIHLSIIQ